MSGGEYMGYMGGMEYVTSKEEQDKFWAQGTSSLPIKELGAKLSSNLIMGAPTHIVGEGPSPHDHQVGGACYKRMKVQPTEFILANGLGFCEGNIIKYVCRYQFKNGKEDLLKARHYIDILLATKYPE